MNIDEKVIKYIINFMVGTDKGTQYIYYGSNREEDAPIIIIPSRFFEDEVYGKIESIPELPLKVLDGKLPILYGENKIEKRKKKVIIYADLIASSYFLLSRYDEAFGEIERDGYGRPVGRKSYKAKAEILERPLVDEYGRYLRETLIDLGYDIGIQKRGVGNIYLTHDLDEPWPQNSLKLAIKKVVSDMVKYRKTHLSLILNTIGLHKCNPYDTFDWLFEQDHKVKKCYGETCQDMYFLIGTDHATGMTRKYWDDRRFLQLIQRIRCNQANYGIHASFEAGMNAKLFKKEKENLELLLREKITANRNHYLVSNMVEWLNVLLENGITDDYTMGYADTIGFRLSTCRAVKWLDPYSKSVKNLVLHPLTIMECTLTASQYMKLDQSSTIKTIKEMIDIIDDYNGDFCFLLHNNIVANFGNRWWKKGYEEMIEYLISKKEYSC